MSADVLFQRITIADATMQALRGPLQHLLGRMEYLFAAAAHFYRNGRLLNSPLIRTLGGGLYKMRLSHGLRIPFFFEESLGGVILHLGEIGTHEQGELWHRIPPSWEIGTEAEATDVPLPEAIEYVAPLAAQPPQWIKREWDPAWAARAKLFPELELHLQLDRQQWAVAASDGPILLRGSAGCGKTTVAIYRLLSSEGTGRRRLYLTFTEHLRHHAEELYSAICHEPSQRPTFWTIEDLCRTLVGDSHGQKFPPAARLTWLRFRERFFSRNNRFVGRDPDLTWEEVQAVIKGDERLLRTPKATHLEYSDYLASPLRGADNPQAVWEVFEQYKRLEGWDDMDLAREAYRCLQRGTAAVPAFDEVIVDESQDLTVFHLGLVLALCRNPDGLFLAGDTQQAIHPSRFDWTRWRETMYREWGVSLAADDIQTLACNYRSPRPVVTLANGIAQWRKSIWQEDEALEVTALRDGPPVRRVLHSELPAIPPASHLSTRLMVICRDEATKRELQPLFTSAHVFTVHEAKGLEGEVVILWDMFEAERELWHLGRMFDPRFKALVNRLVVATTRATRALFVVDNFLPTDWPALNHVEFGVGPAAATALAGELTAPFEARKTLFDRALQWERAERFEQAGGLFERLEEWEGAGRCLYALERWEAAALAYERAQLHHSAGDAWQCARRWLEAARAFERAGSHREAAQNFEKAGVLEAAVRHYVKIEDWLSVGRCEEAQGHIPEALQAYERGEHWLPLARCHERDTNWNAAMSAYTRAGHEPDATRCLERLGRWAQAARCHSQARRHHDAGRCLLVVGDEASALGAFQRARAWKEVGWLNARRGSLDFAYRMFVRAELPFLAFLTALQRQHWTQAATQLENWALTLHLKGQVPADREDPAALWGLLDSADSLWRANPISADSAWRAWEERWAPLAWDGAITAYRRAQEPYSRRAIERLKDVRKHLKKGETKRAARLLEEGYQRTWAARFYEKAGMFQAAARCWYDADEFEVGKQAAILGDDIELLEKCEKLAALVNEGTLAVAEYCQAENDGKRAARFFEKAGAWRQAAHAQIGVALRWLDRALEKERQARKGLPLDSEQPWSLKGTDYDWKYLERAARSFERASVTPRALDALELMNQGLKAGTLGDWETLLQSKEYNALQAEMGLPTR